MLFLIYNLFLFVYWGWRGISLRTRRGNYFTFCIDQKVTKNLVTRKTHLSIWSFVFFSGLPLACQYIARTSFWLYDQKEAFLFVRTISGHRVVAYSK